VIHLTIQQLSSYLDGQLSESSADHTRQHLAECEECALKYAALEEQEALLTRSLTHDPGDAFFDSFASSVQDRIQSDAAAPPKSAGSPNPTASPKGGVTAKSTVPSRPDQVSTSATGTSTDSESAKLRRAATTSVPPARRVLTSNASPILTPSPRPSRSFSWVSALVVVMILGSVGVLVANAGRIISRVDSLTNRSDDGSRAFGSDPLVPPEAGVAPAGADSGWGSVASSGQVAIVPNQAPVAGPVTSLHAGMASTGMPAIPGATPAPKAKASRQGAKTDDELTDGAAEPVTESGSNLHVLGAMPMPNTEPIQDSASLAPSGDADPFAGLPADEQPSVRTAQDAMSHAHSDPSANNYEAAASAWEDALDEMRGRPEQTVARQQISDALFFAWQASPNSDRADAAMRALRTYLVAAPPGLPREEAKYRLAQLSR